MASAPDLDGLEQAVRKVAVSLSRTDETESSRRGTLLEVFRLNQLMGRMARDFSPLAPALKEMQLEVNAMTVRIKRGEWETALAGLKGVEDSLEKVAATAAVAPRDHAAIRRRDL